jgi:hypothetical protein
MVDIMLGLALLMALGMGFCYLLALRAPVGYEDERGFHYGPDHVQTRVQQPTEEFPAAVAHLIR